MKYQYFRTYSHSQPPPPPLVTEIRHTPPSVHPERRLVVAVASLSVVSNQLPAADHLAHGEEPQHLGEQHATSDELRPREVPDLLDGRGRGRGVGGGAGGGLQQALGVLDDVERAVEVALEGGHGAIRPPW